MEKVSRTTAMRRRRREAGMVLFEFWARPEELAAFNALRAAIEAERAAREVKP